jgi:peroxiredoxin
MLNKKVLLGLGLLALVLVLVGGWLVRSGGRRPSPPPTAGLAVGQAAPNFVLRDLAGRAVQLQDLQGRVVLLSFWAIWCPACRLELPELQRLYEGLPAADVAILAINAGDPSDQVAELMQREGYRFPVLLDGQGVVQSRFNVFQYPITFLLDRQGRLAGHYLGLQNWESGPARQALEELMGRPHHD